MAGVSHFALVHGLGVSPLYFEPLRRLLAGENDVFVPLMPGFGSSPRPARPMSVEDYADALIRMLEDAGVTRTVLVGQSMGAQFVVEAAVRRPDLVESIVLIGPVANASRRTALGQGVGLALDIPWEPLRTSAVVLYDYVRCGIRWFLAELREMLVYRIEDRVREVQAPVLVLRGSHDTIAPARWVAFLADRAARATSRTIPRGTHNVHHATPGAVADAILVFLEAVRTATV